MSFKVISIKSFDRQAKRFSKKFPSFKTDLLNLISLLEENPNQGIPIGRNCYKIRLAISSKGKGKSSGARVITHLHVTATTVFLLSVYDKSEIENISSDDLSELLKEIAL